MVAELLGSVFPPTSAISDKCKVVLQFLKYLFVSEDQHAKLILKKMGCSIFAPCVVQFEPVSAIPEMAMTNKCTKTWSDTLDQSTAVSC